MDRTQMKGRAGGEGETKRKGEEEGKRMGK